MHMEANANDPSNDARAERRTHARMAVLELAVRLGDKTYTTANWSMGGFLLEDFDGELATGALVTVAGLGRDPNSLHAVNLPARVVRSSERTMAVNYLVLDPEAYAFLQDIMRESGKMRSLLDADA